MTQSMRALAMRNADLSTSVMINSCGSDACNSTLGRTSASGHFRPPSAMLGGDRFCSVTGRRLATRSAWVGACWPFSPTRRLTMQDNEASVAASLRRGPWNKGKLVGAQPPLRPNHLWSIRTKLQVADRKRDLAMFNLAIDSKLRGCDVVALKVEDIAPHGYAVE